MDSWRQKRIGYITASRLDDLMTRGKNNMEWGKTAISYLYQIEMERYLSEPPLDVDAAPLQFGRKNEIYAIEWLRENCPYEIRYYETDFDEKPFITVDWAKFGATPDADFYHPEGGQQLVEIKTTYSNNSIYKYFSPTKPYEKKRIEAFEEHRNQIAGQFLACPNCDIINLLKYNPQRESCEWDTRSPLDFSRGILFSFTRKEMGEYLDLVKERIIAADKFLQKGIEIELINKI